MVYLIPIGPVPIHLLTWLFDRLGLYVNRTVEVGRAVPMPKTGYDSQRGQYRSDAVLDLMRRIPVTGEDRLVGLIDHDCYGDGLNFIFGQASINGATAFVALPRLRPNFYGLPEDKNRFRERTLKEIVHELGHTWGLRHCDKSRCVMHFSNRPEDTDHKGSTYCEHCRERLGL